MVETQFQMLQIGIKAPNFTLRNVVDDQLVTLSDSTGKLDDSRLKNGIPVTGRDLRNAMDALLNKSSPPRDQKPSLGCNIKWATGNEPHFFSN